LDYAWLNRATGEFANNLGAKGVLQARRYCAANASCNRTLGYISSRQSRSRASNHGATSSNRGSPGQSHGCTNGCSKGWSNKYRNHRYNRRYGLEK
jgi:hypothetical protein